MTATIFPSASAIMSDELKQGSGIALLVQGKGQFVCNNDSQFEDVKLFIWLSEKMVEGIPFGGSGMGLKTADSTRIGIGLNSGTVSQEGFEVKGIVYVDNVCGDELISISAIGSCGDNVSVTVETSSGSKGIFQSNVKCII